MGVTSMRQLIIPMLRTFLLGAVALALLLFIPAGSLHFWQAWDFIVIFLTAANAIGIYLSLKDPELLKRRLRMDETRPAQRIIGPASGLGSIALLMFCAIDHRFGWSHMAWYVSLVGDVLIVLGFLIYYFIFKANSYGGSTIRTEAGQQVSTTGPYALVRHPMYAGVLVMLIGVPLSLGSWWGLTLLLPITALLVWRILDEEMLLEQELPGYKEYEQQVRYRLVPYLW